MDSERNVLYDDVRIVVDDRTLLPVAVRYIGQGIDGGDVEFPIVRRPRPARRDGAQQMGMLDAQGGDP